MSFIKKYRFIILFFTICCVNTYANLFELNSVSQASKILILPALFLLYWKAKHNRVIPLEFALLFSWFGDVFLIFDGRASFLIGLSSFLLAHLLYIFLMIKTIKPMRLMPLLTGILFYGSFAAFVLWTLFPFLESMKIPVVVYTLTIATFGALTTAYFFHKPHWIRFLLALGTACFSVSDIMLAFNVFYYKSSFYTYPIMLLYCIAQFLIVCFFVQQTLKK